MKPLILVIDDDDFYIEEITYITAGVFEVKGFNDPNDLEQQISLEKFDDIALVLVDFDFGTKTAADNDIAGYIREMGYKGPIALFTLLNSFGSHSNYLKTNYDSIISKNGLSLEKIKSLVESKRP